VTNAVFLPLYFISDVFIAGDGTPEWVQTVGNLFPVRHMSHALQDSFDPFFEGTPWPWNHWVVIAIWGAIGAAVTLTRFRWTPRR
jgi:ABC-type multidrug transport system permease subunit